MRTPIPLLLALLCAVSCVIAACGDDGGSTTDTAVAPDGGDISVDAGDTALVPDDTAADPDGDDTAGDTGIEDTDDSCAGAICGSVAYEGAYDGPSVTVYVRVYRETGSFSLHPQAAVGSPDFEAAVEGQGAFVISLDGYTGRVYVSAFMDVDGSGAAQGPNGRAELAHGVFSDPMGAHGGYTFEGDPATEPTPLDVGPAGLTGVDVALRDSGVVRGTIHRGTADAAGSVVVGAFVPEIGGRMLHHYEYPVFADGMPYYVALPPKADWRFRATVGGATGFYPQNPPPAPPGNTVPVAVFANQVTTGVDINLP